MNQAQIDERESMLTGGALGVRPSGPPHLGLPRRRQPGRGERGDHGPAPSRSGLRQAHGFSLNVSNYLTTAENTAYGAAVNSDLGARYGYTKPFVVDTSRNGNGSNGR